MAQEQIVTLAQIYNILSTIETEKQNTMNYCLENLKNVIIQLQREKGEK